MAMTRRSWMLQRRNDDLAGRLCKRVFWVAESARRKPARLRRALAGRSMALAEVDPIYVEPAMQGRALGKCLWSQCLEDHARATGASRLGLDSDPHAIGFYERMGCRVIGEAPSGSIPGRMLPRMEKISDPTLLMRRALRRCALRDRADHRPIAQEQTARRRDARLRSWPPGSCWSRMASIAAMKLRNATW